MERVRHSGRTWLLRVRVRVRVRVGVRVRVTELGCVRVIGRTRVVRAPPASLCLLLTTRLLLLTTCHFLLTTCHFLLATCDVLLTSTAYYSPELYAPPASLIQSSGLGSTVDARTTLAT